MTRPALTPARLTRVTLLFLLALIAAVALAVGVGPSGIGPGALLDALRGQASGAEADILLRIRLPRALLAAIVGAALSVSGVLFQALLRNPLADPFVLGVSGGAALGGVAVLSVGSTLGLGQAFVPPAAFGGALLSLMVLFAVAGRRGRLSPTTLLLTGVVFNAFASAAIVFAASLGGLGDGARVFLWLVGSLAVATPGLVTAVGVVVLLGVLATLPFARPLDLLALGEESAAQLGVDVARLRPLLLVVGSLLVGAGVAVSGLIGFVGLILPHLLRLVLGPEHRLLLPSAALGGAVFLVVCDTVARTLLGGRELPVGAITALAGGPLFLWLLRRQVSRGFVA
jgi:iron complex transport system permease protein